MAPRSPLLRHFFCRKNYESGNSRSLLVHKKGVVLGGERRYLSTNVTAVRHTASPAMPAISGKALTRSQKKCRVNFHTATSKQGAAEAAHYSHGSIHDSSSHSILKKSYLTSSDTLGVRVNDPHFLNVTIGGQDYQFSSIFLRDACRCNNCTTSAGQKTFQTSDLAENVQIHDVGVNSGSVWVRWKNDLNDWPSDHISNFSLDWIVKLASTHSQNRLDASVQNYKPVPKLWSGEAKQTYRSLAWTDFTELLTSESAIETVVNDLGTYGLTFITNVPGNEDSIEMIGKRIGPIRNSFYRPIWDVIDKPNAENIAYTSKYLGLHMDLLYMRDPPGIQLLHCIRASLSGGASMFSDSFTAARSLLETRPDAYESLTKFHVTYEYQRDDKFYRYSRPTIVEDSMQYSPLIPPKPFEQRIDHVNWSPPFQGHFQIDAGLDDQGAALKTYLQSAKLFAQNLDRQDNLIRHMLAPGQCVIFNNRRILHGREAFVSDGSERWLRGLYIDMDDFDSRWRHFDQRARRRMQDGHDRQ